MNDQVETDGRVENRGPLLVLGASTRAAAYSALRAGWSPVCADLFADVDLRAVAELLPIENYPGDFPSVAAGAPDGPWMYTGALENHPEIVAAVSEGRELWGTRAERLADVRDTFFIHELLAAARLPVLAVRRADEPPPANGSWMLRPWRGAAGRGICVWNREGADSATLGEPHYFQRRCRGVPISGLFLAAQGETLLLGVSRQLMGSSAGNGRRFVYGGSVGPIRLRERTAGMIERMGREIAEQCRLRGLFGCDFLINGEEVWLTEVNPRYPASVEVFEHAWGIPLLDWHARACRSFDSGSSATLHETGSCWQGVVGNHWNEGRFGPGHGDGKRTETIVGKLIVYAEEGVTVPALGPVDGANGGIWALPMLADIPAAGTVIGAGQPVCTVFAESSSVVRCLRILRERCRAIRERLRRV